MSFRAPHLFRFFFAIFLLSTGFGIMSTAVPLFATLSFSLNDLQLGILGALAAAPYIIAPAIFGRLSDKTGRRPLIFAGLSLYVIASISYTLSTSFLQLAFLRVVEGISFSLIWPSAEALVADSTDTNYRIKAIGLYSVSWSAGYMIGPFLMGIIVSLASIINSFVVTAILMVASILFLYPSGKYSNGKTKPDHESGMPNVERPNVRIPAIIYTMVIWGFVALSFFFLFPAYASSNGITATEIGFLVGLAGLFRTSVFYFFNRIVAALGAFMLPLGLLFLALSMLLSWSMPDVYGFTLSVSLLGLFLGLTYAFSLQNMLGKPAKGLYAGLFESSIGIGELLGPLMMGFLGFSIYPSFPFIFLAVAGLFSAFLIMGLIRGYRRAP